MAHTMVLNFLAAWSKWCSNFNQEREKCIFWDAAGTPLLELNLNSADHIIWCEFTRNRNANDNH